MWSAHLRRNALGWSLHQRILGHKHQVFRRPPSKFIRKGTKHHNCSFLSLDLKTKRAREWKSNCGGQRSRRTTTTTERPLSSPPSFFCFPPLPFQIQEVERRSHRGRWAEGARQTSLDNTRCPWQSFQQASACPDNHSSIYISTTPFLCMEKSLAYQ